MKKCEGCGVEYAAKKPWQKYCSIPCRSKAHAKWWGNSRQRDDETADQFRQRRRSYAARAGKNYEASHKEAGLCRACPEPIVGLCISWCEYHWLQQAAWRAGLRGKGWPDRLKKLLELQSFTCPYTGKKLEIGVNASIDHMPPRSRFPNLANCFENLEWVDDNVNRAKRSLTKEEFVALCETVAARHEWKDLESIGKSFCG